MSEDCLSWYGILGFNVPLCHPAINQAQCTVIEINALPSR